MEEEYKDLDEYCYKKNSLSVFEKYEQSDDPQVRERANTWRGAIGLQAVDGLIVSNYLIELACKNIEGELTSEEVDELLDKYYREKRRNKAPRMDCETYTRVETVDKEECKRGRPI